MSLQSTYQSRKALLVENLETMGVTGYSENDGLTTLINAVLEIGPTPPTPVPASITLSSDKPIMEKGETATITATVLDSNGNPCEGETVSFEVVNGESLGSDVTDSSGEASVSYLGKGVGDIYIKAECMSLIQTFSIKDYLYVPKLDGTETIHQLTGTTTIANGEMRGGSAYLTTAWDNTNDWELSFKIKFNNQYCGFYLIKPNETSRDNNELLQSPYQGYNYWNGSLLNILINRNLPSNTWYDVTIVKNNTDITITIDNVSQSINQGITTLNNICIGVDAWQNGSSTIKDIVVKPL